MDKYFEILGLKPGASQKEIKAAYRDLAQVWHPDKYSHNPRLQEMAQAKLREIIDAYERLKNNQYSYTAQSDSTKHTYQEETESTPSEDGMDEPTSVSENDDSETFSTLNYETDNGATIIPKIVAGIAALFLICVIAFVFYSSRPPHDTVSQTITNPAATNTNQISNSNYESAVNGNNNNLINNVARSNTNANTESDSNADFVFPEFTTTSNSENPQPPTSSPTTTSSPESVATTNESQPTNPSPPQEFFSIGSSKQDVLSIQGTPDRFTDDSFHYGSSVVNFRNGRVINWEIYYPKLRAKLTPRISSRESYITVGSTIDDVLSIQGTPDRFDSTTFHYGSSQIQFSNGRVVSWEVYYPKLKVKMVTKSSTSDDYFTIGSTKEDVIRIQGTPDRFTNDTFHYGSSTVTFVNDRVKSWEVYYPKLKVKMSP